MITKKYLLIESKFTKSHALAHALVLFLSLLIPLSADSQTDTQQVDSAIDTQKIESDETVERSFEIGIADAIEAEQWGQLLAQSFNKSLESLGLTESWWGELITSCALLIVLIFAVIFLNWSTGKILLKLSSQIPRVNLPKKRANIYQSVIGLAIKACAIALFFVAMTEIWTPESHSKIYEFSLNAFGFILTFALLFLIGVSFFEISNGLVEHKLTPWKASNNQRVKTLLPIARNTINIVLFIILGITLISELGVDIMPLLAGAGVVGFAIGFGAQTIIKDLITGFIIIFEDLIQVGDVARVGGHTGLIEQITIRKVQLRNFDGIVITVPFSEVSVVENYTKEFSCYVMDIGIAYREDPDEAIEVIKSIGEDMLNDPKYKNLLTQPIEVFGVDKFGDSAIIIKARLTTQPIKQWEVGREFNRRLKHKFDEVGIEIPFPHRTLYFGEDKDGKAPSANLNINRVNAKTAVNDEHEPANRKN